MCWGTRFPSGYSAFCISIAIALINPIATTRPIYEGSLGNLLLLSQRINAELQNDDFETKKKGRVSADESKKRTGYSKGSAAELEVNNEKDWTPETIEKTGMTMLKFMEDDQWGWGIKFKSEEEKKNLLLPGIY
jgi:hypothetical protein